MVKKGVILVVLFSMMLHCASRVGFLSYLYQQRHEIAYTIGLIAEVPIAQCSSEYDFDSGLTIKSSEESDQSLPPAVFRATEILLFCIKPNLDLDPELSVISVNEVPGVIERPYSSPALSIFHPPS